MRSLPAIHTVFYTDELDSRRILTSGLMLNSAPFIAWQRSDFGLSPVTGFSTTASFWSVVANCFAYTMCRFTTPVFKPSPQQLNPVARLCLQAVICARHRSRT